MVINGNGGKFAKWSTNGLLATVVWVLLFIVYTLFKILKIEDPILTSSFQLLTGAWIGNLAMALGAKQKDTEKATEHVQAKVEVLTEVLKEDHPEKAGEIDNA